MSVQKKERVKWRGVVTKKMSWNEKKGFINKYNETALDGTRVCRRCFFLDAAEEFKRKEGGEYKGTCSTCAKEGGGRRETLMEEIRKWNEADPDERQCEKCTEKKPKAEFARKHVREGDPEYTTNCEKCSGKSKETKAAIEAHNAHNDAERVCPNCQKKQPKECFANIRNSERHGPIFNTTCRTCSDDAAEHLKRRCAPFAELLTEFRQRGCKNGCSAPVDNNGWIEADHRDPSKKVHEVSNLSYWSRQGLEKFKKELEKCAPLCHPCHVLKTHPPTPDRVLTYTDKFKINIGYCQSNFATCKKEQCTAANVSTFDCNHIDPSKKEFLVSRVRSSSANARNRIEQELSKCELLCRPCHLKVTSAQLAGRRQRAEDTLKNSLKKLPARKFTVDERRLKNLNVKM